MEAKTSKKSYYLPGELTEYFAEWAKPGREYSAHVGGAMLVWMALEPDLRHRAREFSIKPNIRNSVEKMKKILRQSIVNVEIQRFLDTLSDKQRAQLLADMKASKGKLSLNP